MEQVHVVFSAGNQVSSKYLEGGLPIAQEFVDELVKLLDDLKNLYRRFNDSVRIEGGSA